MEITVFYSVCHRVGCGIGTKLSEVASASTFRV